MSVTVTHCPCSGMEFRFMFATNMRVIGGEPPELGYFHQCPKCGLIRLREEQCLPDTAYEDETYRETIKGVLKPSWWKDSEEQGQAMAELMNLPEGESVADIGAGYGFVLKALGERRKLAIEPNEQCRAHMAAETPELPTLADLPDEWPEPFDHVISVLTLEHVESPWAILKKARRLMHTESRVHIVVPALDVERAFADARYRQVWFCAQHRWYFTPDALAQVYRDCGFKPQQGLRWERRDGWRYTYLPAVVDPEWEER